jgi:arginine utilization protein RocB
MPVWEDAATGSRSGSYSLPLEAMQKLGTPVFNWGVHGRGAHQRDESVQMSYSFETLPQLLYETIEQLARLIDDGKEIH